MVCAKVWPASEIAQNLLKTVLFIFGFLSAYNNVKNTAGISHSKQALQLQVIVSIELLDICLTVVGYQDRQEVDRDSFLG